MKRIQSLMNGLVVGGIALAMVSTLAAQTATQGAAKVVRIKGKARYALANTTNWQPLHVGDLVKPGSIIQTSTEPGAYVDIVLGESEAETAGTYSPPSATSAMSYQPAAAQNVVRVYANTALGIDKLTTLDTGAEPVTETELDLKAGHIFGSVKKMSAASSYKVKIPNGVAGIRGTTYDITSDGVVGVTVGSVVLAYIDPNGTAQTQTIVGGQQFDARTQTMSPIPPTVTGGMEDAEKSMHYVQAGPVNFVSVDSSLYKFVSPTHGKGHHGHGPP